MIAPVADGRKPISPANLKSERFHQNAFSIANRGNV
jgi:hypothetical protein